LVSSNITVFVVDDFVVPFRVTDQDVPVGSPDSENVTVYLTGENVTMGRVTEDPDTVSVPEYEDGAYILSAVEFSKV
jgi:hypothetical protein